MGGSAAVEKLEGTGQEQHLIRGLQQQIKILELEVAYLRKEGEVPGPGTKEGKAPEAVPGEIAVAGEELGRVRGELQSALVKLEAVRLERGRAGERLAAAEKARNEEKERLLGEVG